MWYSNNTTMKIKRTILIIITAFTAVCMILFSSCQNQEGKQELPVYILPIFLQIPQRF